MRIDNTPNPLPVETLRAKSEPCTTGGKCDTPAAAATGAPTEDASLSRSTELNRFVFALKGIPETRDDVVARIQAQVQAGTYLDEAKMAAAATNITDAQ
jgi:hypothetical protein